MSWWTKPKEKKSQKETTKEKQIRPAPGQLQIAKYQRSDTVLPREMCSKSTAQSPGRFISTSPIADSGAAGPGGCGTPLLIN